MPEIKLNPSQKAVVEHSGSNLLVSAGAGSGKTFVLTQHVMHLITDPQRPVDIDRLLIVTFTKAAAAEMRERISGSLKKLLNASPEDPLLLRQNSLIPKAQICTIDSFCSSLLREFFQSADLDPDSRVAEAGELKLLRRDAFDRVMERKYDSGDPGFIAFMDSYTGDKDDEDLFDLIDRFLNKVLSKAAPRDYLDQLAEKTKVRFASLDDAALLGRAVDELKEIAADNIQIIDDLSPQLAGGKYEDTIEPDIELWETVYNLDSYTSYLDLIEWIAGGGLGRKNVFISKSRSKKIEPGPCDDLYDVIREKMKDAFKDAKKDVYVGNRQRLLELINETNERMSELAGLLSDYYLEYQEAKRERNVIDFSDIEHMALKILSENPDIELRLRRRYDEVIIDEYQDSNDLQEAILSRISNGSNMFMVGDVKQSIYGFRNANPALFMNKNREFRQDPSKGRVIDLKENYRCRSQVVDSVNEVFDRIMTERCGGVDYRNSARLVYGADYPDIDHDRYKSEYMILESSNTSADLIRSEALMIAQRIKDLTDPADPLTVRDKSNGELRPARLSDIVILVRNLKGDGQILLKTLNEQGIDTVLAKSSGFYDTYEVNLILDWLRIIDNPRQDIPLAAVLASPTAGFDADELAALRAGDAKKDLYELLGTSGDPKAADFIKRLEYYRKISVHMPVYELIDKIIIDTRFDYYVSSLNGSGSKLINLEMLKELAKSYEASSYSGIFDFNRYVEEQKKYDVEQSEGSSLSEEENVVRIMTIHASKGLEFPVVFLSRINKMLSKSSKSTVLINDDHGLCADHVDPDRSVKTKLVSFTAARTAEKEKDIDEELRILYVAMTRAREKLIVTASKRSSYLSEAWSMLDSIPAGVIHRAAYHNDLIALGIGTSPAYWDISTVTDEDLGRYEEVMAAGTRMQRAAINIIPAGRTYDNAVREMLDGRFNGVYFNSEAEPVRAGYSVSELKKLSETFLSGQQDDMGRVAALAPEQIGTAPAGKEELPDAGRKAYDPALAAETGTAYHLIFEKLDPERGADAGYISDLLDGFVSAGLISPEAGSRIRPAGIAAFYEQEIGRRAAAAAGSGHMWRERPFVLGVPASDIKPDCRDEEPVIVQGIIDMYFTEGDKLILVDYKSDYVAKGGGGILAERYSKQLEYYGRALEAATGKKPDETYIYSIRLESFIPVGC